MAAKDKRGSLLVEPSSEVHFSGPALRSSRAVIKLINPTDNKIVFKIKTTAPSFYGVRPNFGVVKPHDLTEVEIARQPFTTEESSKINHKFMVQSLVISGNVESYHKAFANADPSQLGIVKLRCIFSVPKPAVDPTISVTGKTVSLSEKNEDEIFAKQTSLNNSESKEKLQRAPEESSFIKNAEENLKPFGFLESEPEEKKCGKQLSQISSDIKIFQANEQNLESAYILKHEEKNHELRTMANWEDDLKTESKTLQSSEYDNRRDNKRTSNDGSDVKVFQEGKQTSTQKFQYYNNKKTSSRVSDSKQVSPRLSPVRTSIDKSMPKMEPTFNKVQQTIKKEKRERNWVEKSDDNLTPLQLLSLNTELLRVRTENSILRKENEHLKKEIESFHSPVRLEYIIPHSELPRMERSIPLYYVIASMTLAVICVFIGKYVV